VSLPAAAPVPCRLLALGTQRLDDLLAPEPSTFMSEATRPVAKSGKERNLFGEGVSTPAFAGAGSAAAAASSTAAAGTERLKIVEDKRQGIRVQNLEVRRGASTWRVLAMIE